MKKNGFYILLLLLSVFWACDGNQLVQSESDLPKASPVENEILVVMDSSKWKGALGEELREIYTANIPGLPQGEPAFNVRYVSPRYFKGFLKLYPNIIFVTTLEDNSKDSRIMRTYFTENSLEQIRRNPDMFMFNLENEFARGQQVMHLFAQTEEQLIEKLEENEEQLRSYFLGLERTRLSKRLFTGRPNKELSNYVQEHHGFWVEYPLGYEVAVEGENFIWTRFLDPEVDKNIWAGYQEFDDEGVFTKENILALRSKFARQYIFGNDSTTYMKTETDLPVFTREVNFNGRYAIETRGLWRLNNMTMGGPFVSYTFVDEQTNRLYYIEGFVYAPGENKRQPIRELEAILWTFKTNEAAAEKPASVSASKK